LGAAILIVSTHISDVSGIEVSSTDQAIPQRWAHPHLTSPIARKYRTILRKEATLGPNLDDHYRALAWGCGTSCRYWAVINLSDGAVWVSDMDVCAQPRIDENGDVHWIDAQQESAIVRIYSCPTSKYACSEDSPVLFRSYVWSGDKPV